MKKVWCYLLSLILCFSLPCNVNAAESVQNFLIPCVIDENRNAELSVRVTEGHVWVNAEELAEVLGYSVSWENEKITFSNYETRKMVQFYLDSTRVEMLYMYEMLQYTAPFESVVEEEIPWIPFEFALLMLDSSMMIAEDKIQISPPQKNILNSMSVIAQNSTDRYLFDWERDFGYTGTDVNIIGAASVTSNLLNELVKDPTSYLYHVVAQFNGTAGSYDEKYSDELAMLMMVESKDEVEAMAKSIETIYDLMSPKGKLGSYLEDIGDALDNNIGVWQEVCEQFLEDMKENNTNALSYNLAYNELEKVLTQQAVFENTGGFVKSVQDGLPEELNGTMGFLEVFSKTAEFMTYVEEFTAQDEFAVSAMKNFCQNANPNVTISGASLEAMKNKVKQLQTSAFDYMIGNYLQDHLVEWTGKLAEKISGASVAEMIGAEAELIRMAWDLASDYVPFIKDGLDSTEKFELALYAQCFQENAFTNSFKLRDSLVKEGKLDETKLYELAQSYYVFLKSCMITRDAAVASLASKKYTLGEDVIRQIEEYEKSINQEIAEHLVVMKRASVDSKGNLDNGNMAFGFLQSDNEEYLREYDEGRLVEFVKFCSIETVIEEAKWDYGCWLDCYQQFEGKFYLSNICGNKIPELLILDAYDNTISLLYYNPDNPIAGAQGTRCTYLSHPGAEEIYIDEKEEEIICIYTLYYSETRTIIDVYDYYDNRLESYVLCVYPQYSDAMHYKDYNEDEGEWNVKEVISETEYWDAYSRYSLLENKYTYQDVNIVNNASNRKKYLNYSR